MLAKGVFEVLSSRSGSVEVGTWGEVTADVVGTSSKSYSCSGERYTLRSIEGKYNVAKEASWRICRWLSKEVDQTI